MSFCPNLRVNFSANIFHRLCELLDCLDNKKTDYLLLGFIHSWYSKLDIVYQTWILFRFFFFYRIFMKINIHNFLLFAQCFNTSFYVQFIHSNVSTNCHEIKIYKRSISQFFFFPFPFSTDSIMVGARSSKPEKGPQKETKN